MIEKIDENRINERKKKFSNYMNKIKKLAKKSNGNYIDQMLKCEYIEEIKNCNNNQELKELLKKQQIHNDYIERGR